MFDESRAAAEAVELPPRPTRSPTSRSAAWAARRSPADLVLGAYRERLPSPMTVVRDYYLPGWIGEGTLVS